MPDNADGLRVTQKRGIFFFFPSPEGCAVVTHSCRRNILNVWKHLFNSYPKKEGKLMNELVSFLVLQGTASKESTPSTFTWNSGQACIEIHQMMGFSVWHQRNCTGFLTGLC